MRILASSLPVLLFAIAAARSNAATILFSDLGTGSDAYDFAQGYDVSGPNAFQITYKTEGFAFYSSSTALLGQIDAAVTWIAGTNGVVLSLYQDSGGLPGSILDSWTLANLPTFGAGCCTLQTVVPHVSITLTAGTQYWLVAAPAASNTLAIFNESTVGVTPANPISRVVMNNGGPFVDAGGGFGAFDVLAATPEPTTFGLIAVGVGLLAVRRVRASPACPPE